MTLLTRTSFLAALLIILAFAPSTAKADPLLFSNVRASQSDGSPSVDLFSHVGTTLLGPQISFLVDITGTLPPNVTNTVLVTYQEVGGLPIIQSFEIPLFGTIQPPFTLLFTVISPGATPLGTSATLTIDILGSSPDFIIPSGPNAGQRVDSQTYSFNVASPVPEPATLFLLSSGLVGIASGLRRRKSKYPQ